jgi:YD repeat-containing protein
VQQGVTAILRYDPIGRVVRTDNPDGTHSRVVIGGWRIEKWDPNDTVLDSLWYAERGSPDPDGEPEPVDPARRAAWLTARHAGTPHVSRMDSLGREVRAIADAGPAGLLETVTELDIEGNPLSVTDPRGVVVQRQAYDLAGRAVRSQSPDAGQRWTLPDVNGTAIRVWDSRGHLHESLFDLLRRPTRVWVTYPTSERKLVRATWHGEEHAAALPRNLLGRAVITLDESGMSHSMEYDFKGNLLVGRQRLAAGYQQTPDWAALDPAQVSTVEIQADGLLDKELYQASTEYDALNRPVTKVLPDGSVAALSYNVRGALETMKMNHEFHVRELEYDAKGQRQFIVYGNFVRTRHTYDPFTYRLTRLETLRSGAPNDRLQDLHYTYDPAGNVVETRDDALQTHFYAGQVVTPSARYAYDPLYRLSAASGREHGSIQDGHGEAAFGKPIPNMNDAAKLRRYTETYEYDGSGT